MIGHGAYGKIDQSIKGVISNPTKAHNALALVKPRLADLPLHLLQEFVLPNLSDDEADQLIALQYENVKSILKLWSPRRRLKLLQRALRRTDPAFDNNYLLRYSASKGFYDVVELLLNYQSVDPKAHDNWALILAKENGHAGVYELLCKHVGNKSDLDDYGSSYSLLMDLVTTVPDAPWKYSQQRRDLQLLLDSSTKILPFLKDGIFMAIDYNRNDLAKIMLDFVAFDRSFFNHLVLIKQLAAGNSLYDLRKIDPFTISEKSLFLQAVENQNVELANFMLDEGIHWIHLSILMLSFKKSILIEACDQISQQIGIPTELAYELNKLEIRIRSILHLQILYEMWYLVFSLNYIFFNIMIKFGSWLLFIFR